MIGWIARFEEWWSREGRTLDPDTSDVDWHTKRKGLAAIAFMKGMAQGRNYTCDDSTFPGIVDFANGRRVQIVERDDDEPYLSITGDLPYGE